MCTADCEKGLPAASIHAASLAEYPDAQKLSALQEATWRTGSQAARPPRTAGSSRERLSISRSEVSALIVQSEE